MLLNLPIEIFRNPLGRHVTGQLPAYLDSELPDAERTAVHEHLQRCARCQDELATLRAAQQILHALPALPLPRSFKLNADQVAARDRQSAPAPIPGLPRSAALAFALRLSAAACALLLLLLVLGDLTGERAARLATMPAPAAPLSAQSASRAAEGAVAATPPPMVATMAAAVATAGARAAGAAPANAEAPATGTSLPGNRIMNQAAIPRSTASPQPAAGITSGAAIALAPAVAPGEPVTDRSVTGRVPAAAAAPVLQYWPLELLLGLLAAGLAVAGLRIARPHR